MLCTHKAPGRHKRPNPFHRLVGSIPAVRRRPSRASWCATLAVICAAPVFSQRTTAQIPGGPGKDATIQLCGNCHEVEKVVGLHQNAEEWTATISKMMDQGALGTEAQLTAVLNYLVKNFGSMSPVNVNTAPASELESKLDITGGSRCNRQVPVGQRPV